MVVGKLYILCGLPRSGKTRIANQWATYDINILNGEIFPNPNAEITCVPRTIVCSDDIRLALHGCRWSTLAEDMVHAIQGVMIRALLKRSDVLIDGTNTTKSTIRKLLSYYVDADFCIIDTPKEICIQRAIDTNQLDLLPIIERMDKQLKEWKHDPFTFFDKIREEVFNSPKHEVQIT